MQTLSLITTRGSSEPSLRQLRRRGSDSLVIRKMPYPGMKAAVHMIKHVIETYRSKKYIRHLALKLTAAIPRNPRTGHPDMRNFDAIADAIYDYVVSHDVYTRDPYQIERLQMPDATIASGHGDCDDMVMLSGALLESVGVPTRIRLLGQQPNTFTHIQLQYKSSGQWKGFDPTLALWPGYKIPESQIKAKKVIPISHQRQHATADSQFTHSKAS